MTFAEKETSRFLGDPISLFRFSYGDGVNDVYRYTDHEQPVQFDEGAPWGLVTYNPVPIWTDNEVTSSGTLDRSTYTIRTAESSDVTGLFKDRPPSTVVGVIVRQGHVSDPDKQFLVSFAGRVLGFASDPEANETELTCEPIGTSMKRNMLRRRFQYGCPYALYDPDTCKASEVAASSNFVVLGINGATFTLANNWVAAGVRSQFVGGKARWIRNDGRKEVRTIIDVTATTVLLNNQIDGLDVGEAVTLIKGCNHTMAHCRTVHNNIRNFGGQPWIPTKNPVGVVNNYY